MDGKEKWSICYANMKRKSCDFYEALVSLVWSEAHPHLSVWRSHASWAKLASFFIHRKVCFIDVPPVHQRDNKKHSAVAKCFLKFDKVEIISWSFKTAVWYREYRGNTCDIVHLLCVFVQYREYREYRPIKCCTKFAPRSHQHSTLFCSTNWNLA